MKYMIHYTVAGNREKVLHEGNHESVDDVIYLITKVYKCKSVWYTSVETESKGKNTKQTLNHVYGSLVSYGLAGVIG